MSRDPNRIDPVGAGLDTQIAHQPTFVAPAVLRPAFASVPVITGALAAGSTLTVTTGGWANTPTSFAYQWRRGGNAILGATTSTYALTAGDNGYRIDAEVTATNAAGPTTSRAYLTLPIGTGGGTPTPTPTPTLPSYATLTTFGDSVTFGVDASATANRWANLVAASRGATLYNNGISGTVLQNSPDSGGSARANNGRDRFQATLLGSGKRAAAFIAYGFNDARYVGAPTTFNVAGYKNDYQEMLNGLRLGGYAREDLYVITPYYISDEGLATGSTGFAGQTRSGFEAYVTAATEVAAEFGTRFTPAYSWLRDNGFAATTVGDKIHPNDAGMALIVQCIETQTVVANTRAVTTSVTATANGSTVSFTASAVSGAVSYEFALIGADYANGTANASTTPAASTTAANGTYWSKVRAVFSDGGKGPWAFSATTVTVTGAVDTTPPVITSPAAYSAPENAAFTATLTANEAVTWTLVGGADQARFSLAGASWTLSARDFEAPADADTNNTYLAIFRGTDGSGNTADQTLTVTITDVNENPGTTTTFLNDTFSVDPQGTLLLAHTPETGGAWVAYGTGAISPGISDAGRIYARGASATYRNSVISPSADCYVETVIDFLTAVSGETVGVALRVNEAGDQLYWARWSAAAAGWQLFKTVGTSSTQLGTTLADAFDSGSRTLRLTAIGSAISASVGGVTIASVTDTAIAAAGYAGIRSTVTQANGTGRQMTSIRAVTA